MAYSDGIDKATDAELAELRTRLTKRLHALDAEHGEAAGSALVYRSLVALREKVSAALDTRVVSPARPR